MGEAGDADAFFPQTLREVIAGGIAFHVGAEGEVKFFVIGLAAFEFGVAEVFGVHAVERRNFTAEHVIAAIERAGFFDVNDVDRSFYHAYSGDIAAIIGAKHTWLILGERAARLAKLNAIARGEESIGQMLDLPRFALDEVQCQALGGARTDAG